MLSIVSLLQNFFLLSSSMDKTVKLWHISRKECLCCFQHSEFVTSIAFHPRVRVVHMYFCYTAVMSLTCNSSRHSCVIERHCCTCSLEAHWYVIDAVVQYAAESLILTAEMLCTHVVLLRMCAYLSHQMANLFKGALCLSNSSSQQLFTLPCRGSL